MDKLQKIYDLYLSKGLISEAINIESFSSSNPEQIQKLYDLGKDNGLFQATDINVFSSAWDEKKNPISSGAGTGQEENTESTTEIVQEDGSLASGQNPARELSSIEQKYQESGEEAVYETVNIPGGGSYRKKVGVVYNQPLIDELMVEPGVKAALDASKITAFDIKTAASNDPSSAKFRAKVDEFRVKSSEEISEILTNENLNKPYIYEEAAVDDGFIDSVFSNAQLQGLQNFNIEDFGPLIENDKMFPEKCNVTIAQVISSNHIKINVWERGAGKTLACGTAACAATVAAYLKNLTINKIVVSLPGGDLDIEYNSDIVMSGATEVSFKSSFEIN